VASSSRSCTRLFENFLYFFDHETSRISKQEKKMMQNKRTFGSWVASQEALVLGLEPDQILLFSRWSVKKVSEIMLQPLSIHLECTRIFTENLNYTIWKSTQHFEWSRPSGLQLPKKEFETGVEQENHISFMKLTTCDFLVVPTTTGKKAFSIGLKM
jgi:hypothetical protein